MIDIKFINFASLIMYERVNKVSLQSGNIGATFWPSVTPAEPKSYTRTKTFRKNIKFSAKHYLKHSFAPDVFVRGLIINIIKWAPFRDNKESWGVKMWRKESDPLWRICWGVCRSKPVRQESGPFKAWAWISYAPPDKAGMTDKASIKMTLYILVYFSQIEFPWIWFTFDFC